MNVIREIDRINKREATLELSSDASWHAKYRDSAYIYVGGLDYELTEGDVLCIFEQYGEVVDINLVRDKATGKSKGFAFLCYEDQRSTDIAVDNFSGIKVCGRVLRVDHVTKYKPKKLTEEEKRKKEKEERKEQKRQEKILKKEKKRQEKEAAKRAKREEKEKERLAKIEQYHKEVASHRNKEIERENEELLELASGMRPPEKSRENADSSTSFGGKHWSIGKKEGEGGERENEKERAAEEELKVVDERLSSAPTKTKKRPLSQVVVWNKGGIKKKKDIKEVTPGLDEEKEKLDEIQEMNELRARLGLKPLKE